MRPYHNHIGLSNQLFYIEKHILLYFGGKHCEFSDCPSLAGWLVMLIRKSRTWLMLLKRCHQSILCDMIIMGGISTIKVIHFGNLLLSFQLPTKPRSLERSIFPIVIDRMRISLKSDSDCVCARARARFTFFCGIAFPALGHRSEADARLRLAKTFTRLGLSDAWVTDVWECAVALHV